MRSKHAKKLAGAKPRAAASSNDAATGDARFTPQEAAVMAQPHKPKAFLVSCIDSRFQPARALNYGPGVMLEHRPIACVVPPEHRAGTDILSRMAFRRLNDIRTIVMVCHSDCGGIQAALQVLKQDVPAGEDLHEIATMVHGAAHGIEDLGRALLAEEHGDLRRAGDRLARDVGVKSLHNLMAYKGCDGYATIGCEIAAGACDVLLLYYDLEHRRFDVYDRETRRWQHAADAHTLFGRERW